ncbi:hypothetical protein HETIRDRAFT_421338 [Heterobasidion irregulare TC 32-1]|uniref:Uncharacterized protein n=1 Tax=Heterobasidion irregulare (strain TC 32-1) TaxID=747525 RepID=W4JUF3_HETIT|nr:uncharacterized protein HETIRDRAFT_421338 [Heterobasidion irregulare TC 32-1]ETW77183.1 hypothetical protein HETIRDRAFT_421338 [Heterobasidion irregulare TC 32-1]
MCTFCYQNFTSFVCKDCFNHEKFIMRDDRRLLKYAYRWKDSGLEERDNIETQ